MELARFFSAKSSAIELQMKTNEVAGLLPQGCLASMRKNMTKRRGATITKRTKKKTADRNKTASRNRDTDKTVIKM